jgi:hypothetical protein
MNDGSFGNYGDSGGGFDDSGGGGWSELLNLVVT